MAGRGITRDGDEAPLRLGDAPVGVSLDIWSRIQGAVAQSDVPLAVFDADGTLWADDLGETHLAVLQERQLVVPAPAHATVLDEYHARCARDVAPRGVRRRRSSFRRPPRARCFFVRSPLRFGGCASPSKRGAREGRVEGGAAAGREGSV